MDAVAKAIIGAVIGVIAKEVLEGLLEKDLGLSHAEAAALAALLVSLSK